MAELDARAEIDQGVAKLAELAQRLRGAGDTEGLDYLQQQLFVLGAQIGEDVDELTSRDDPIVEFPEEI